jgi:hypothetical protein
MTAAELILEANRRGVVLGVRDGLIVARPAGALPPEFKAAALERKLELISLLSCGGQGPDLTDPGRSDDLEAERYAERDIERYEADKAASRGFDVDPNAPSHAEWAVRSGRYEVERIPHAPPRSAAKTLLRTCKEHGVGLRLDPDGTLVVVSNGRAWRSLVTALEAHVDAVAVLLAEGCDGSDA